jgi:hypothetical protein
MTPAALLRDLSRARAVFQQRTILAVIGHHTGDIHMTAPTLQDRLGHTLATMMNDDDSTAGTEQRQRFIERTRVVIEARDALDAAQARIAALEKVAKAAFGLVCHDQWGTHMYTDDGMWSDAQKLIDALAATDPPASDTRD